MSVELWSMSLGKRSTNFIFSSCGLLDTVPLYLKFCVFSYVRLFGVNYLVGRLSFEFCFVLGAEVVGGEAGGRGGTSTITSMYPCEVMQRPEISAVCVRFSTKLDQIWRSSGVMIVSAA